MNLGNAVSGIAVVLITGYIGVQATKPLSAPVYAAPDTSLIASIEPSDRLPERYQASFLDLTPQAALDRLGVSVFKEDKIFTSLDLSLGLGGEVRVYRAQPVLIKDADTERLVRTWAKSIDELVVEQNLELAEKDEIVPARGTVVAVQEGPIVVSITRVAEAEIIITEPINFTTKVSKDPELPRGEKKVIKKGEKGTLQKTIWVQRKNGVKVAERELMDRRTVLKEPVAEEVVEGTKVVNWGSGGASWYAGVGAMTAAHRTLPKGTVVRVVYGSKSVLVTIADRGPFIAGRIIDLSADAFKVLAPLGTGVIQVTIEKP